MIYRRLYNPPATSFLNAFDQLDRMRRHLDRVFGEDYDTYSGIAGSGVFPQINLTEDADRFYLRAELPGVKTDDLEIQATAKNLSLTGERKIEPESDGIRYHRVIRIAACHKNGNIPVHLPDFRDRLFASRSAGNCQVKNKRR